MDYHVWGARLEEYHKLRAKPKSITELKEACQISHRKFEALLKKNILLGYFFDAPSTMEMKI